MGCVFDRYTSVTRTVTQVVGLDNMMLSVIHFESENLNYLHTTIIF